MPTLRESHGGYYPAPLTNPDNSREKQDAYFTKLNAMNDVDLQREAEHVIWLSAFAANNPRSCYHWQADACFDEAEMRGKPEIYKQAYDAAKASCGF